MATLKHLGSKNADYGAAEQYLLFEHDEFTMKPVLDENGRLIPREDYRLSTLNCGGEDFAVACMRSNLRYEKNQRREDVKSHHYIISFDPRDGPGNGLTVDRAQALGEQFCKEHFPGHQALVCTHPDGHNHSGNIHVHIVINSLRIEEVPFLPYMDRPADTKAGCKHRCTDAALRYFKSEVMEMCHREGLYQIDLLNGSKNRVTDREYWAQKKGQAALDKQNAPMIAGGITPRQTKFETNKEKLRQTLRKALATAASFDEFSSLLLREGVTVKESRGRLSYLTPDRTKPITARKLGGDFDRTAVHLLENREYTGCLVNFKTEKPSYKVKHSVENPIEKQAIFPNHHEPIIDTETWERVQELRKQRKRPNRYDEVGLFSGMLFCADCGHVLYQQRYQNKNRKQDCYICGSYKKRTRDCTAHFIRTDLLTAGVLSNLRQVTEYAARHESRFVKLLIQQNEIGGKRKTAAATKQLEQAQTRIAEVNRIIKRLYEDNVSGKISDERFMELSADYEQEQRELKDRAAALQEELSKSQAATVNAEKFMGIVRKHLAFEELTPTLLREMIEKIVVHECSYDENGTRRQDIEIYYSFVGKIDLPEA
ncbi:relaxase [Lactobacillus crispatus]|nr:relaxase/mobilization nuclease domain-containing protein [Lactobacillus crispatus]MBI1703858.1 relaxase [Lactobacillus crispatus]